MKRRLKTEVYNRKKFQSFERSSEEAREFEESLLRLAQLSKNRVKMEDFTPRDKYHLLDLFVNNERTLLKIYEALFPHRANMDHQFTQQNGLPEFQQSTAQRSLSNFRTTSGGKNALISAGAFGEVRPAFGARNAEASMDYGTSQRITYENNKLLQSMSLENGQGLPAIAK